MNRKILYLGLMCISLILFAPLTQAQIPPTRIVAWTDKPQYLAGQTGKLYITYNNDRIDPVTIHNITIVYEEWWAYINNAWVGNTTFEPTDTEKSVTEETAYTFETGFTVPSDGRARTTAVFIVVYTNEPIPDSLYVNIGIRVVETPAYVEQIVTLFTIQVVLLIVCTIIIAATIFLSARRPHVTWKQEEKAAQ